MNNGIDHIRTCQQCDKPFKGRSDKIYCSDYCRNRYNNKHHAFKPNYNVFGRVAHQWQERSIEMFPAATAVVSLVKLEEQELPELREALILGNRNDQLLEYVDCLMCLLHSAAKAGFDLNDLTRALSEKAEINYKRKWKENSNGTYSHVKE